MILHKEFTERESDFTASTGWADSWKKTIWRKLNVCREIL
jgi:hypothetical protein